MFILYRGDLGHRDDCSVAIDPHSTFRNQPYSQWIALVFNVQYARGETVFGVLGEQGYSSLDQNGPSIHFRAYDMYGAATEFDASRDRLSVGIDALERGE